MVGKVWLGIRWEWKTGLMTKRHRKFQDVKIFYHILIMRMTVYLIFFFKTLKPYFIYILTLTLV